MRVTEKEKHKDNNDIKIFDIVASNKQINKQERAFSKTFNPLFWGFLWNREISPAEAATEPTLSILFFEVFFWNGKLVLVDGLHRLPFNPLFWGFLWNWWFKEANSCAKYITFNPLFWGFLWNFHDMGSGTTWNSYLSILFFEVFFETMLKKGDKRVFLDMIFQSSFLRFSLKL